MHVHQLKKTICSHMTSQFLTQIAFAFSNTNSFCFCLKQVFNMYIFATVVSSKRMGILQHFVFSRAVKNSSFIETYARILVIPCGWRHWHLHNLSGCGTLSIRPWTSNCAFKGTHDCHRLMLQDERSKHFKRIGVYRRIVSALDETDRLEYDIQGIHKSCAIVVVLKLHCQCNW